MGKCQTRCIFYCWSYCSPRPKNGSRRRYYFWRKGHCSRQNCGLRRGWSCCDSVTSADGYNTSENDEIQRTRINLYTHNYVINVLCFSYFRAENENIQVDLDFK